MSLAPTVKNCRVGDQGRETRCKQKRARFVGCFGSLGTSLIVIVLGGLLFGAATSDDGAVVAGFPAHGQVRQCAMPDADSSLRTVRGKLASETRPYRPTIA